MAWMRARVDWMTQADERVLEFLHEKEIIASPGVIGANIDYTGEYISRRWAIPHVQPGDRQ